MDALPLAGNLSLYELFRQLVPETALGAVAVVITAALFLSVVALWLWCCRFDEHPMSKMSAFADTADSAVALLGSPVVDTRVSRNS